MSDKVTIIITIAVAVVILIAIWRYKTLKIRGRVAGAEGELSGEIDERKDAVTTGSRINPAYREVETKIGGMVQGSKILTIGGDLVNRAEQREAGEDMNTKVRTEIQEDLTDSEIKSIGGDSISD